ncbi:acetate kinase [bacterium]|nr:acetate kinase [bacterium]
MNILVLNCGSSSAKFQIIQTDLNMIKEGTERCLASGICEKIGAESGLVSMRATGKTGIKDKPYAMPDHRAAINAIFEWIDSGKAEIDGVNSLKDIDAVGHRILHGGEKIVKSTLIDDYVISVIEECIPLGPLHNPAQVKGIRACIDLLGPSVPQVAVFDTDFHSTMAPEAFLYPLPYDYYERLHVRRYGFHGTSHRFITGKYAETVGKAKEDVNIISAHLGNGSSITAVKNGKCIDTTMGHTPHEGLMMGTRCGDIDAAAILYIMEQDGLSVKEVDTLINKKSGLLGISGISFDMRDLEKAAFTDHNEKAKLALDMFVHRIVKYIGAYFAEMGGAEAVVFTGGIGENSPLIRGMVCSRLGCLGIDIDEDKNKGLPRGKGGEISKDGSKVKIYVLPTNEELMIARDTVSCVEAAKK